MIWRIRTRTRFTALAGHGRRVRRGPLSVTVLLDEEGSAVGLTGRAHPEVGFAIGRRVGPAVVRNRVRRRLRAVIADVHRSVRPWPAGAYLFTCAPAVATLSSRELRPHVEALSAAVLEGRR